MAVVFVVVEAHERGNAMAYKGLKVMDSDMHVMEPGDLWKRYIEPEYRSVAPAGPAKIAPYLSSFLLVNASVWSLTFL